MKLFRLLTLAIRRCLSDAERSIKSMKTSRSDSLRFLPVALDVRNKKCVIVGGGSVGTRKAITLLAAGAAVTIVSPVVTGELAGQIDAGQIIWQQGSFKEDHIRETFLVVAATDDESLNAAIVQLASKAGSLFCDASSAERSQVIFGALLQQEQVTVAVFTDGQDPAQARTTRDKIASLIGHQRG